MERRAAKSSPAQRARPAEWNRKWIERKPPGGCAGAREILAPLPPRPGLYMAAAAGHGRHYWIARGATGSALDRMVLFRKKPDVISDRARALNDEIAQLEHQIKKLDAHLQREQEKPRLRSTALPH